MPFKPWQYVDFFLSKQKCFWQNSGDLVTTKQISQPSTYIMYFASRNRIVLSLKSMGNNVFKTCVQDISKMCPSIRNRILMTWTNKTCYSYRIMYIIQMSTTMYTFHGMVSYIKCNLRSTHSYYLQMKIEVHTGHRLSSSAPRLSNSEHRNKVLQTTFSTMKSEANWTFGNRMHRARWEHVHRPRRENVIDYLQRRCVVFL